MYLRIFPNYLALIISPHSLGAVSHRCNVDSQRRTLRSGKCRQKQVPRRTTLIAEHGATDKTNCVSTVIRAKEECWPTSEASGDISLYSMHACSCSSPPSTSWATMPSGTIAWSTPTTPPRGGRSE